MKMLTEFSTLTLRRAAAARAAAGGANVGAPAAELDEAMDASDEAADAAGEASPDASQAEPSAAEGTEGAERAEGAEGAEAAADGAATDTPVEQKPDPIVDAIAAALAVAPDRALRMLEALDIIGNRIDEVRLVRVFQGEQGPYGSIARGQFHYAIDRVASRRRGRDDRRDDRRGGRGGDRGGDRRGGPGGPGGDRRDKPRGLGSLKTGAPKEEPPRDDDRPGRGEM